MGVVRAPATGPVIIFRFFHCFVTSRSIFFFFCSPCRADNKRLPGGKSLNKRHKVFGNGSMVVENVQKKTDQGIYYCEASNEKHVVRASVDVTVIGKTRDSFA